MWLRLLLGGLTLLFSSALLGVAMTPTSSPIQRREAAEVRWGTRPADTYRIRLELDRNNTQCEQQLLVHGTQTVQILRDTCQTSWLSNLTVSRLFELSKRLELAPECYPSVGDCACRRLRVGQVSYDSDLGVPVEIVWQREVQPHWRHAHYWAELASNGAAPTCRVTVPPVRVTVLELEFVDAADIRLDGQLSSSPISYPGAPGMYLR